MSETFLTQVAFVTGRVLHEGTGRPVDGELSITADEGYVVGKYFADGRFVVSGYSRFPQATLRLRVTSAQYRAGFFEQTVLAAIPPGADFDPPPPASPDPLVDLGTILLPADPVNLRGRVVLAADPSVPVDGAELTVTHAGPVAVAPALTDADGYFRFDEIAVRAPAQIQCAKAGFDAVTRTLLLDFGRLINEEYFRLRPS